MLPPRKPKNTEVRPREYLTEHEIDALMVSARKIAPRHGHRNATLILLAYRHGLRVAELIALRWDRIDLSKALLSVRRVKNGVDTVHPLHAPELRALRKLHRDYPETPYVFVTERRGPLTDSAVRKIVAQAGHEAGMTFPVHPHMLRHACGFTLANAGHDPRSIQLYLGHRYIQHTVRYTALSAERFKGFWND